MNWTDGMRKNISGVILAAGLSQRMGTPKMLLPWGQTTVLGQVVAVFSLAGIQEIIVVTGGARQEVESEVEKLAQVFRLRSVYNPHHETGEMLSSLQYGLASLGTQVESALIGLGDQPQLSIAAVMAVVAANKESVGRIIVPSHNMRRGHPWLLHRKFWSQILALESPLTMRDFLNSSSTDISYVETDSTILNDIDTPDEYAREKQ